VVEAAEAVEEEPDEPGGADGPDEPGADATPNEAVPA
jgi:hypothetical protein